ncbi:conserved hypothetical protein [Ricinus communis]|uniref:Uncharacterized protein n=1 Tax=Ricinus communis TaxID=3988 RepID=B9SKM1_RICCO|nr:conserved hypothetical protein [Ricinus communis]
MAQICSTMVCTKDEEESRLMLLCGVDRGLVGCFDVVGVPLSFGSAIRIQNAKIGAQTLGWVNNKEEFTSVKFSSDENANASNWFDVKSVWSN